MPFLEERSTIDTATRIRVIQRPYPYHEHHTTSGIERCVEVHLSPITLLIHMVSEVSRTSDRSTIDISEKVRDCNSDLNLGNDYLVPQNKALLTRSLKNSWCNANPDDMLGEP